MIRSTSFRARGGTLALALFAALLAPAVVVARGDRQTAKPALAGLAFIAGSWEADLGGAHAEEHWIPPAGGAMLAVSRTLADSKMVAFEYLRIVERADGIYYIAQPNGVPPTEFKLTKLEGERATFENPQHDFPKAIQYEKKKDGGLAATISGGGRSETFPFKPMKR